MVVDVSDTGHGMDKQAREKCFDPFFTTKELGKGTGLGLSTTYGIVKDHDGEITVDSGPHQGTVFRIRFPLASAAERIKPEQAREIVRGRGQRILVIDREVEIHKAMKHLIDGLGYRCRFADKGPEALDLYKSWHPQIVLLDLCSPVGDESDIIDQITAYDPDANIAAICESGSDSNQLLKEGRKQTLKGYLTIPIDLSELSTLLMKLLTR